MTNSTDFFIECDATLGRSNPSMLDLHYQENGRSELRTFKDQEERLPPGAQKTYSSLATVVKMEVRFEPTFCMMATAATEINTAIRAYSIAVAPSSFLNNSTNV
jgi:hypothetical protein